MVLKLLISAVMAVTVGGSTSPYLSWVTPVVYPNQTVMASGSGFNGKCVVEIKASTGETHQINGTFSHTAIMATIPAALSLDVYSVRVGCSEGSDAEQLWSQQLQVNVPEVLWVAGTCQNTSIPGGQLRLFGSGLTFSSISNADTASNSASIAAAKSALAARNWSALEAATRKLQASESKIREKRSMFNTRLLLSRPNSPNITLDANTASLSQYHAAFTLPPLIPAGEYTVTVANGLGSSEVGGHGWVTLDMFESPSKPHVTTVVVQPPAPSTSNPRSFQSNTACRAIPPAVFDVTSYGPRSQMPPPKGTAPIDASGGVRGAIAAAHAAGGGTVYFPRGQYFLIGSFEVANNVHLRGEGMDLVALYWAEANHTHHPTYLFSNQGGNNTPEFSTWGISDLAIYATAYYYNIIIDGAMPCNTDSPSPPWHCTPSITGFVMRRVRIRANAFFASVWGPYSTANRPRPNVNFNFSQKDVQGVVMLTGTKWVVSDCDILGTGNIFWSGSSWGGYGGTAWGQLSRNVVRNGGNSLAMDQWKQVIVEDNVISGASLASAGNHIATYNGGYAQHVVMINNSISHVWGGDREVMTYDNAGGAYFGPLASVSSQSDVDIVAAGPRIPLNRFKANSSTTGGGWVVEGGALIVLNGTGAGQIRRIVASTSSTGWTLDAPLDPVTLSGNAEGIEPSFVQMLPFRGRNLFHQNHFADVGAFQFYGIGLGNIVAENKNERMAGMVSWGQWREWHGPTSMMPRLGGEMGCGANPNMRNVFEGNVFAEGNTIVNYNTPQGASDNFLAGYLLASTSGGGAGNATGAGFEHLSMNSLTVFRDNTIKSNGGILITDDSMDIVVEGNTVMNSDLNICVTNTTRNVVVRNNNASVSANC